MLLAWRLLQREWQGGELRLLACALLIAVCAASAVGFFTSRVEQAIIRQASSLLGADLVLETARPVKLPLATESEERGLRYSEQQIFPSMLMQEGQMLLASIKAVDKHYPLKGHVKRLTRTGELEDASAPEQGVIWAEPRIIQSLQLSLGQPLELGHSSLTLAAELRNEPDRGGNLYSLQPRAIMNLNDLPATGLIAPGSRVQYRYLFAGAPLAISSLKEWLRPRLRPGERLLAVEEDSPSVGNTLERSRRYLNLAGLLAAAMAAIAVALAARRYAERQLDGAALLRTLGLTRNALLRLYLWQLLGLGVGATLLGLLLGWLAQWGLIALFSGLIQVELPPSDWHPILPALATGPLILIIAALPALLEVARVAPLRVLRRELSPRPVARLLIYSIGAGASFALLWSHSGDLFLSAMILMAGTLGVLLLWLASRLLIKTLSHYPYGLSGRLAMAHLQRHPQVTLPQITAFALTLAALALLTTVRTDLLDNWRQALPPDAPNHFLINIQPNEFAPLAHYLDTHAIEHSPLYAMVRGRLSHINGQAAATQIPADSHGHHALRRELNLSWSNSLPDSNEIIAGRWWRAEDVGKPLISIESKLAGELGVNLGDLLRFDFGDRSLEARIVSVRTLRWESMQPNFYVLFPPETLNGLPHTGISSFYLDKARSGEIKELLESFPTLTLLELEQILSNLRVIVNQVSHAVEYALLFVLFAGIVVLWAGIINTLDSRLREGALLRTLGASDRLLDAILRREFLVIGGCAGLLAILITELCRSVLYSRLGLSYTPQFSLWLYLPAGGAFLVLIAGTLGTRKLHHRPPLSLLRDT